MRKKRNRLPGLALLLCILSCWGNVIAQNSKITITGNVVDSSNANLSGATVSATGKTTAATSTDLNGKFVIDVEPGTQLIFSMVGFVAQTVTTTAQTKELQIKLLPAKSDMENVVITAFGKKQVKEAVVGSVATIEPGKMITPASNLTNALVGQVAGIIGFQQSGQPGLDNSNFFVRGATTFGYRQEPIILIDNIELTKDDLARLQVDDIASFTILKDASSTALYGARGANGVILVTTKRGASGKPKIDLRVDNVISEATKMIDLANPITYMNIYNQAEGARPPFKEAFFTADKIYNTQQTINNTPGSNRYVYPAVDWLDLLFKKRTSNTKATANVSGGGNTARYFISGTYNVDNGNLKRSPMNDFNNNVRFKTYQLRGNIDMDVTKTTLVSLDLWGNFNEYSGPITNDASFSTDLYAQATHTSPVLFAPYYEPDSANRLTQHILFGNGLGAGSSGGFNGSLQYYNPYAEMLRGFKTFSTSTMQAILKLNQKLDFITRGLSFNGFFSTNRYAYFDYQMAYKPFYYTVQLPSGYDRTNNTYSLYWINSAPGEATEYLIYQAGQKNATSTVHFQGNLNYSRRFGDHKIDADLVGIRTQKLNANGTAPNSNTPSLQYALPYRNLNFAGKINYTYKDRYVLEHGFGYNGTERFAEHSRFGYFPTGGVAWIVSREKFWGDKISNIISSLKLRASVGLSGNDNIGPQRFYYLSDVSLGGGFGSGSFAGSVFGSNNTNIRPGVAIRNYPNPDVTWERSTSFNYGMDITIARKLDIIAEYWTMHKKNILLERLVPQSTGLEASLFANLGSAKSHGVDLTANYLQQFSSDLTAQFMGNFTYSQGRYTSFEEPNYIESYRYTNGSILGQPRGYIAERLFVDDKEAASSPSQVFPGATGPVMGGDIKYRDLNGDGRITGADMAPIGFPVTPQIAYGFGFTLRYKAFDLGTRFQGSARTSFFINPRTTSPFIVPPGLRGQTSLLQAYADDHWSFDNQDMYALYPRMATQAQLIENNMQTSTWWIRNGSYLRMKYAELGYSLPRNLVDKMHLTKCRLYMSATNLINFTNFKLWDVEMGGNAFNYPLQRQYSLSINIGL
ncbi:SusC/RagA family TonB-linked outer membrane protein [Niabella hirudinis]|uniref:SusC/RagA family TonB-linked outer membrane protein n=1 Tax=Niabella hirudinis TaxID=1285929 RepID=UPI003EBDB322